LFRAGRKVGVQRIERFLAQELNYDPERDIAGTRHCCRGAHDATREYFEALNEVFKLFARLFGKQAYVILQCAL
jgi:hypothetical protein